MKFNSKICHGFLERKIVKHIGRTELQAIVTCVTVKTIPQFLFCHYKGPKISVSPTKARRFLKHTLLNSQCSFA